MTTKPQHQYAIGERVAERPKGTILVSKYYDVNQRISKYRSQRYGTVVNIKIKANRNGSKRKFLVIQWDHLKTPTEHEQMRICPVDQLVKLQAEGYGFQIE